MKKTSLAVSLAVLSLSVSSVASAAEPEAAPASPHTFTGNVAAVSNYVFRGITQSGGDPAIQGGFDYSHASGLYAGTWASNVSWVTDNISTASNSYELDLYAGYKGSLPADFGYDLGVLTYIYPGSRTDGGKRPCMDDTRHRFNHGNLIHFDVPGRRRVTRDGHDNFNSPITFTR